MKKLGSMLLVLIFVVCLCAAAAPGNSFEVTGTNMVLQIPKDYVVFDQKGVAAGDAAAAGWDKPQIAEQIEFMQNVGTLLYAEQIDRFDTIYVDCDSFMGARDIQDFTKFCQTSGKNDEELIAALEEASYYKGPNAEIEDYINETAEIVTINGEKYGYSVGYYEGEYGNQHVIGYSTVKNGKAICVEMYIDSGEPKDSQIQTLRNIIQSVGYTRGAAGFLSQFYSGINMTGAALLPLLILGVVVIAAVVVLIIFLRIRRKKHPKQKKEAQQGMPLSPNGSYTPPAPQQPYMPQDGYQKPQQSFNGWEPIAPQTQTQPIQQPISQQAQTPPVEPVPQPPIEPQQPEIQQMQQPETPQMQPPVAPPPVYEQPGAPPPQNTAGQTDIVKLLENLAELKRQGVITPEEYEIKKAELLRRL